MEKILIANRGEIALRIARACRELGIPSVAVYSTAYADSAVARFADEAVQIGPPAVARSYLHIPSIIGAALKTGADAIHPGYGFLSEDPYFAEICADHSITFIGPTAGVMERMGNKAVARQLMSDAGLPLLPGTIEPVVTADEAQEIADSIGLKKAEGALVAEPQPNGPAAKAGIEAGDVVTAVNGEQVKDARDLAKKIGSLAPKATVKLAVVHKGAEKTVNLTLGELPNAKEARANASPDEGSDNGAADMGKLGLTLAPAGRVAGAGSQLG